MYLVNKISPFSYAARIKKYWLIKTWGKGKKGYTYFILWFGRKDVIAYNYICAKIEQVFF